MYHDILFHPKNCRLILHFQKFFNLRSKMYDAVKVSHSFAGNNDEHLKVSQNLTCSSMAPRRI